MQYHSPNNTYDFSSRYGYSSQAKHDIPPQILKNINECFNLFSRDGQTIPIPMLSKFLYTLGIVPSDAEIRDLENELCDGNRTTVSKSYLVHIVKQRIGSGKNRTIYGIQPNSSYKGYQSQSQMGNRALNGSFQSNKSPHSNRNLSPNGKNSTLNNEEADMNENPLNINDSELYYQYIDQLKEAFQFCDSNKDEYIDIEDMMYILKRFGESISIEEVKYIVKEMDHDNDGKVSFNDFRRHMGI